MQGLIENVLAGVIGGAAGWYISTRWELLKAWKAYDVARLEIDRNIRILCDLHDAVIPIYSSDENDQQRQIDEMLDTSEKCLPVRVQNLVREDVPRWAFRAWDTQLHLLCQVLREDQLKAILDLQERFEATARVQKRIGDLVAQHGSGIRDRAMELFEQWERLRGEAVANRNPLPTVSRRARFARALGFRDAL